MAYDGTRELDEMKIRLLDFIVCPSCRSRLSLAIIDQQRDTGFISNQDKLYTHFETQCSDKDAWVKKYDTTINTGFLHCQCGTSFPVIHGVPRLILNAKKQFSRFYQEYKDTLNLNTLETQEQVITYHSNSKKSFEFQWSKYKYKDRTWGKTLAVRLAEFQDNFQITTDDLKGKLIYDAGCGNGRLVAGLAPYGCETVALDYTESVVSAEKNKAQFSKEYSPFVHYVQGDLSSPPIKKNRFDFIHSSGVIHHTPTPKSIFKKFSKTVKSGGKVYLLMYRKRDNFFGRLNAIVRFFTTKLPKSLLFKLCAMAVPFHRKLSNWVRKKNNEHDMPTTSEDELSIEIFDNLSPKFQFRYTLNELMQFFEDENIQFIKEVGHDAFGEKKHCICILGVKK
jgi:SAM-dependent methyltransferase/uncharacterized protein YbaR (Trm112 family)